MPFKNVSPEFKGLFRFLPFHFSWYYTRVFVEKWTIIQLPNPIPKRFQPLFLGIEYSKKVIFHKALLFFS